MAATTLRVRAREGICPRYDLVDAGFNRKVCRRLEPSTEAASGFAWVDTGETEDVPNMKEYRDAIADGALWAADEDTARAVWGDKWRDHFDASFGTEKKQPELEKRVYASMGESIAEEKV